MKVIREAAAKLNDQRQAYVDKLHPDVAKVIGHLHLPLLDWLLKQIEYEDWSYMESLMAGRPMLGPAHRSNVFPKVTSAAEINLQEWSKDPYQRNVQMIASVKPTGDSRLDWASWVF